MDREVTLIPAEYDRVVVGGGLAGVCLTGAGARVGERVARVQHRSLLGGNAPSERRVFIRGSIQLTFDSNLMPARTDAVTG